MSDQHLKQLIDRILRCREAEDEAKADTREVYAEAKSQGYDKVIIGKVVAHIRARQKDAQKVEEQDVLFVTYLAAYESSSHAHTREEAA